MKDQKQNIKNMLFTFVLFLGSLLSCEYCFANANIDIPTSLLPVVTGARPLGFGGAYIGLADSADSAALNPGGLVQLRKPEFSFVLASVNRREHIQLDNNPEASGTHNIIDHDFNFFSFAFPKRIFKRDMVFAVTYQNLYEFNREWLFDIKFKNDYLEYIQKRYYKQTGRLTAIGLSYCLAFNSYLSFGFTFNIWKDGLTHNRWQQYYKDVTDYYTGKPPVPIQHIKEQVNKWEEFAFKGYNANIGFLWTITEDMSLGAVFKSPFTADIEYSKKRIIEKSNALEPSVPTYDYNNKKLKMPLSYGLGFVYHFTDEFLISSDLYMTNWDRYRYLEPDGVEKSPFNGILFNKSNIDPTLQFRMGGEYLYVNKEKRYVIPFRAGFFYDPTPAENKPDDFFGISFGSGIDFNENDWFSLDFAYQYRFGKIAGRDTPQYRSFSQKIHEHKFYLSIIIFNFFN